MSIVTLYNVAAGAVCCCVSRGVHYEIKTFARCLIGLKYFCVKFIFSLFTNVTVCMYYAAFIFNFMITIDNNPQCWYKNINTVLHSSNVILIYHENIVINTKLLISNIILI